MIKPDFQVYLCGMKKSTPKKREKAKAAPDSSTEEKIKNAARLVFHKKGFAATRTRDIAEEAGINLALLNYYFRSKQKLFDIIMLETMQGFTKSLLAVFNETNTTLDEKFEIFADRHIELLLKNPGVPIFMLSEMRSSPDTLFSKIGAVDMILKSHFIKQFNEAVKASKITAVHPLQVIMTMLGMTAFPFVAKPLLKGMGNLSEDDYTKLMLERKKLIPRWIKAALKAK